MITINKVKSCMCEPKHDEYVFHQLYKKHDGERAVVVTVYKPTPEISELYRHFNVQRIMSKDPREFPFPSFYMRVYKVMER